MKTKKMSFRGSLAVTFAVALVAIMALGVGLYFRADGLQQSRPVNGKESNDTSQMTAYATEGRYDEAVKLGLTLLRNDSSDEFVYQQIADVYLLRARKDRDRREQWCALAVSYLEKSLALNSRDKDVGGTHLLQDALSFEAAADLSVSKQCDYYDRASKLLEERLSLLHGEQITVAGRTFPLEPLRRENDKVLARVKDKGRTARCQ